MANPYAEISKSRSKKNPFKVRYIGANSKVVASSETLTTIWNCKKNIRAMISVVNSPDRINKEIIVVDSTKKTEKIFRLFEDGSEVPVS